MKPEQIPPRRRNATYVFRDLKIVFVSTPKAACTATKWLLATAANLDPDVFYRSLSGETTRATTIHQNRWKWTDIPRLQELSKPQLAEIDPQNGWMVFSLTRHPAMRLWSAWQSKLLLGEPRFHRQFQGEDWLPRIPTSTDDVIEDWEKFVIAVGANPDTEIMSDYHFEAQSVLLNVPTTTYTRLYDTSEFSTMLSDLRDHLGKNGWHGELVPRRSNETPLPALERAFSPAVLDVITTLYADDYTKLGYTDPKPSKLRSGDYSDELITATAIVAERGERIGDLSRRARHLEKRLSEATAPAGATQATGSPMRSSARSRLRRALKG